MTAISINHVSIHAEDLEQSAAFYEQLSLASDIAKHVTGADYTVDGGVVPTA
jgi:predicted enzyme related to lactoylglutathione lyase